MKTIGFLGFGNMAKAIATGIIKSGFVEEGDIYSYDPNESNIDSFDFGIVKSESPLQFVQSVKFLFICVKPQFFDEAIAPIVDAIRADAVIVSIVAGVSVEHIKELIGASCPVVRTMPNTPLLLGCGATAIAKPDDISKKDYGFVCELFRCVGSIYEIPADKFNEITPVNGSSPAFIYWFAKIIAECAREAGIDYGDSLFMFSDTLIGSARMIKESGYSVDTLIDMVSSKGGTTVSALEAMQEGGFENAIKKGYRACVSRAYQLGKKST